MSLTDVDQLVETGSVGSSQSPDLNRAATVTTVVVPTRNEAANVAPLLERLRAVLDGSTSEVIFVDDSDDETPAEVEREVRSSPAEISVRLLHRSADERAGGLGTAVAAGIEAATGDWVVVMDGDLQHPPEVVPQLVAAGVKNDADIVVGSRRAPGGDANGLSGPSRVLVSGSATILAKAAFPRALRGVSDPMSGFFAVRREAVDVADLRPEGFKILMEILVRTPQLRRCEVGFVFDERVAGLSKASGAEGLRFVRHVARLNGARLASLRPTLKRASGFGVVGLSGIVVNTGALWVLVETFGLNYLLAAILATQVSTSWNFLLTDRLVYRGDKSRPGLHRFVLFLATNNVVLIARVPLLAGLVALGMNYLVANVLTLLLSFALRFATSDRLIYRTEKP